MNWHSWQAFVDMGGHGPYVWGSVGVVLAGIALEVATLAWRRRALLLELKDNA